MEYSLKLWDEIKDGLYDVYISDLVIAEMDACPEPKRSGLFRYLDEIAYVDASVSEEAIDLAKQYVAAGIIPVKYEDDAFHIAMATILDCSAIVSWNFTHMVKLTTIIDVNGINLGLGYRRIEIVSPMSIAGEEEE
jgi:predicted nucleic acid-binding protein